MEIQVTKIHGRHRWHTSFCLLMFQSQSLQYTNVTISYEEQSTWNFPSLAKRQRYVLYQIKNIPAIFFICQVKTLKHEKIGTDHVGTTFLHPIVKLGPKL